MSKLKTTPPLVSLRTVNTAQEVEIRLHEPLIQKQGSRKKRIGLQILNALARLEVLLNKEEALAISEDAVQHLTQQQYNKMEIEAALNALETSLLQLEEDGIPKKDTQTYLSELGLTVLFPKSAKRLVVNNIPSGKVDALAHFNEMNVLNQLASISLQLQQDIKLQNHKYMAHQLALLYQCLNQAGGHFLKYKSRVELHFDSIKALTSNSEVPKLNAEQKEWLSQVTADIVTEALFSGRPVTPMSQPLATYLNEISEAPSKN
ncbi:19178_t:CDS:2 [Dentiscutata erythropus]|uniref:19178_t:CDS:1 n=1 Tax=Dentiscutata erythropus TaxID=1348616 RepID=A0A9N8Z8M8_9GLOM|nr:19178_t:CDS:2 [Dentiscutata erythropus]